MYGLHRRLQRRLPAYLAGEVSASEAARIAGHLARCPACRAECDAIAALAERLRANDPASPPDPARLEAMLPALRAALRSNVAPSRASRLRPAFAACAAALLFVLGGLAGATLFPREVPHETVRVVTREVRVPVPVARVVTVEVPVERVVTKVRTQVVYRDRVVVRTREVRAAERPQPAPSPAVPKIVVMPVEASGEATVMAARPVSRPAAVEF